MLNGRIHPVGVVEGFAVEIGAGGTFCPKHVTLPLIAYFFQLSDDNAPSPYLVRFFYHTLKFCCSTHANVQRCPSNEKRECTYKKLVP